MRRLFRGCMVLVGGESRRRGVYLPTDLPFLGVGRAFRVIGGTYRPR